MRGYLCSSASRCPSKGPPQLNICTSTRLITHNTPAQPLPSLSPPQSSLERRRKGRRWEECFSPPLLIVQYYCTVLFDFPTSKVVIYNVSLCPTRRRVTVSDLLSHCNSITVTCNIISHNEGGRLILPLWLSPQCSYTLLFKLYLFVYLLNTTILIQSQRTIMPILGIIPISLLVFISQWEICHALCQFWWELSVWSCFYHWFDYRHYASSNEFYTWLGGE